jgi:hypothetical protein
MTPVATTRFNNTNGTMAKFATGVVDNGGKFATCVVDIGDKFAMVPSIPVVHLDFRISPLIFEKI